MSDPIADTEVAGGATEETASTSQRIRTSRPTIGDVADYAELLVVDPAHYVLGREIARGSMGRIHVARDRRLGREVAIKEVLVESQSARRRFEREARITSRLQHPSIVSVHEAGMWPSGDPFYAMRLVTGRSLDEVIAGCKTLDDRIALVPNVLAIADAMAYAHGERVIHRDLKPRNIVVAEFGETVVVDWGLAKDLTTDASLDADETEPDPPPPRPGDTTVGDVLGTPSYMPPEQAAGWPVDERADVYSIGAILYYLLAGHAPFAGRTSAELLAAVLRAPPPPLADVIPTVPRELAAIVERAMARDPAARYPTARELAEDLRRFQTGQLVGAHRYSPHQLLRRWVGRHRAALLALGVGLAAAIAIGVFALTRVVAAERRVEAQRKVAIANQQSAEGLMRFMLGDLRTKLIHVGKLELLDAVAHRATAYYDVRGTPESDDDLELMASAHQTIGYVLQKRTDLPGAGVAYEQARANLERLVARHPEVARYEVMLAGVRSDLASVAIAQGDLTVGLAGSRNGLAAAEHARALRSDEPGAGNAMIDGHQQIAEVLEARGDLDGALGEYRRTLELARAESPLDDDERARVRREELDAHSSIGRLLVAAKHDRVAALVEFREGLRIGEEMAAKALDAPSWRYDVATSHSEIGKVLLDENDLNGALAELVAGTAIADRLVEVDPTNTDWADERAAIYEKLGMTKFAQEDYTGSLAAYRMALVAWTGLSAQTPTNTGWQRDVSIMANKLGDIQLATKDIAGALASYRTALATRERLVATDPTNALWERDRFYSHYKIAGAYEAAHQLAAARDELHVALGLAEAAATRRPANIGAALDVAGTHESLADVLVELHDPTGARAEYEAGLALARTIAARPDGATDGGALVARIAAKLAKLR